MPWHTDEDNRPVRNGLATPHRLFISAAEERAEWNQMVLTFGPKNEQVQKIYDGYKTEIAKKRGVSVESYPK